MSDEEVSPPESLHTFGHAAAKERDWHTSSVSSLPLASTKYLQWVTIMTHRWESSDMCSYGSLRNASFGRTVRHYFHRTPPTSFWGEPRWAKTGLVPNPARRWRKIESAFSTLVYS